MTIEEFADIIDCKLIVERIPLQKNRWTAKFENSDTKCFKGSSILSGTYGNGKDTESAIHDYIKKIENKILVLNAMSDTNRKEYGVPFLTY